jgi:hypothetical protein
VSIDINLGTIVLLIFQVVLALLGWLALRSIKGVDESLKNNTAEIHRLDRDLMILKAELPRDYTRREDFIRTVASIDVKIDNVLLNQQRLINLNKGD